MSIEKLRRMIEQSSNIVFFGGAGTSTESGIPDFRSEAGLYKTETGYSYPPEVLLSRSFFIKHPEEFFSFYKSKMIYDDASPNDAHKTLVKMERKGKLKAVITQNIDGLHQAAGSREVLELHGSVYRNYCMDCQHRYDLDYIMNSPDIVPRCCECGGIVRPDVVLYEEGLDSEVLERSISYIAAADMMIVGGTSLVVNPAASLVNYYKGNKLVLINKSATPYDGMADIVINDSIGKILKQIVKSH